jgi:serine/threonine protein kinase
MPEDPSRFRVRTWRIDRDQPADVVKKREALIRRPTEAVAKIGRHPNLLPVLQFELSEDGTEFFEVTEWSEYGTLHGYLTHPERGQLTLRERLEIAAGVAAALEAVHAHGVVHRNLCPESVLVDFARQPRLTDFDRAYLDSGFTVFTDSARARNEPYVPPELENTTDYDFDTHSDMYSFGVLLFRLLTEKVPFASPKDARERNGRPTALPSELRPGVDPKIDALVLELLRVDDFHERPTATKAIAMLRDTLGMTTAHAARDESSSSQPRVPAAPSFEPGTIVDGVYRVDGKAGAGSFSKVYKVFHLDHQKTYAMKLVDDEQNDDLVVREFNDLKQRLPAHPNIGQIVWMTRLAPPHARPYVLYEFIEGETLEAYCDGKKRLAGSDIRRIGLQILSALEVLHSRDVIHRDIKPANIMLELPSHTAKLIDFNVAALAGTKTGRAGTRRYMAPDVRKALGVGDHHSSQFQHLRLHQRCNKRPSEFEQARFEIVRIGQATGD